MNGDKRVARLHITDLPETTDSMIPGGVYAVIAETPPARFPLLATSMAGAIQANIPVSLLISLAPQGFLDRLAHVGFPRVEHALETGLLQVFQLQDDFSKKMFRFGAEAFLSELDHFHLPAESLLVIDQADELLSLHDINLALEQAEAMAKWAKKLKVTVLMVFTRVAAVSASLATLTGLMDHLAGIVRLGGHQDGLDLTFEYWQSVEGTVAARNYGLDIQADGRYRIKPPTVLANTVLPATTEAMPLVASAPPAENIAVVEVEEPPHMRRHLYTAHLFDAFSGVVQGQWQHCDSVMGMIRAAYGAQAPTTFLLFERDSSVRELAEAVHTLRLSLGKRAHIVVVERDASLRYPNEILLLRLGASLIVHRDAQESRIPLMLESLRGQVFNRDVEMDFEAALSSVAASGKRGYLPPSAFVKEVALALDRAELLDLPSALISAKPLNDLTCIELLAQLHIKRSGDLVTTDGTHCFIFLGGCPQSSVPRAIQAITGKAPSEVLSEVTPTTARPSIRERLDAILVSTEGYTFPDTITLVSPDVPKPLDRTLPDASSEKIAQSEPDVMELLVSDAIQSDELLTPQSTSFGETDEPEVVTSPLPELVQAAPREVKVRHHQAPQPRAHPQQVATALPVIHETFQQDVDPHVFAEKIAEFVEPPASSPSPSISQGARQNLPHVEPAAKPELPVHETSNAPSLSTEIANVPVDINTAAEPSGVNPPAVAMPTSPILRSTSTVPVRPLRRAVRKWSSPDATAPVASYPNENR